MHITAPFLQMLDGKRVLMMPKDSEFPFAKIDHLDYIMCSHETWHKNKNDIIKKTFNKPRVIFID